MVCPDCYYDCPQGCGFRIQCKLSEAQCEHSCVAILKSQITQLHAENEELKTENAIILSDRSEHKKRVKCGIVLARGEQFYRCYTCQLRRMSIICLDCFKHGQHAGHRAILMETDGDGWYCDCGDNTTFEAENAACSKHKP